MEDKHFENLDNEYREKRHLYLDFSAVVKQVLEQALSRQKFRYLTVTNRAKTLTSAAKRFREKKCREVQMLGDLAACRVIFYLESDRDAFASVMRELFGEDIEFDSTKADVRGYNSIHATVSFGENRLSLPEYSHFKGLKCEIQVTTTLHHAWSEVEHDIGYKASEDIKNFDPVGFEKIKEGFKKTMHDKIQPAMRDLENLVKQYDAIKDGSKTFNFEFFEEVKSSTTLNDLEDKLDKLKANTVIYGDKTPDGLSLVNLLKHALENKNKIKKEKRLVGSWEVDGTTEADITYVVLEILGSVRYFHTKVILEICSSILKKESDQKVLNKTIELIKSIAKYRKAIVNTPILFKSQEEVLAFISKNEIHKKPNTQKIALASVEEILNLSLSELEEKSAMTFSYSPSVLISKPELRSVRKKAIKLLIEAYTSTKTLEQKKEILRCLNGAFELPTLALPEEHKTSIIEMVNESTSQVLEFYSTLVEEEDFEIISDIETQVIFIKQRSLSKTEVAEKIIEKISKEEDYKYFKVLTGYDHSSFPGLTYEEAVNFRRTQIDKYLDTISKSNLKDWKKIMKKIAKNVQEQGHLGFYIPLCSLLTRLSNKKPEIGKLLGKEKYLHAFQAHILQGLWLAGEKKFVKAALESFLKTKGKRLEVCAQFFIFTGIVDKQLVIKTVKEAIKEKDSATLQRILFLISSTYKNEIWLKKLFFETINKWSTQGFKKGLGYFWDSKTQLLENLSSMESSVLIRYFKPIEHLDYTALNLLSKIVQRHPEQVSRFFLERIETEIEIKKENRNNNYDAIPYHLDGLETILRENSNKFIPEVLKWLNMKEKEKEYLYKFEAGNLLKKIYKGSSLLLEEHLGELIDKSEEDTLIVIHYVIKEFGDAEVVWNLIPKILKRFTNEEKKKEITETLYAYMSHISSSSGFFGFYEGAMQKIETLPNEKYKGNALMEHFLKGYRKHLEGRAKHYEKMGEDDKDSLERQFENK